ncbi:MAG: OsmC family protein [Acidobacteria bacterium]|nr:OsmC family protein [Acidobacteriota bacterium]
MMKTSVQFAGDDFFVALSPGGHAHVFETNSERKSAATPVEMLLSALGACTGADITMILAKKRQKITGYRVEVTGERREEYPRSFTHIHIHHIVRGRHVSENAVAQAIELSDTKYCSVAAALRPAAQISNSFEIVEEGDVASEAVTER